MVAVEIDAAVIPEIVGTIAGDDTSMVITTSASTSRTVAARLMAYTRKENV